MPTAQRTFARSKATTVAVDSRALLSFVVVNLLTLVLILSTGAALLRGT